MKLMQPLLQQFARKESESLCLNTYNNYYKHYAKDRKIYIFKLDDVFG